MRWLVPGNVVTQIHKADPAAAAVLGTPWVIGDPATLPDWYGLWPSEPVARYRSFAQFQNDLAASKIDPAYRWVLYDPENWPDTPASEQDDPWEMMHRFGQCAHAAGYRVIMAPARDLGNVKNSVHPKEPGENLETWYLRTNIPMWAAEHADVIDVQAQALTVDPGLDAYAAFVKDAVFQARVVANPYVKVLAGVSTRYGTAQQMAAAARSVTVAGYWLNIPDGDTGKACEFLRLMGGAA